MADRLPPKGYSITRGPATNAAVQCQSCGAQGHWTYECPKKASSSSSTSVKPSTKLSRTQMLRFGIQKPLQEIAPPKSDREVYDEQFKEAEKQLLGSDATTASAGKKRPREEATITAKHSEPASDAPNPLDQL
ncbi:zinc finger protein, putative [Bodo saltans]|uniref:Zinc finger protein, putative n=1 Tax=Bodo saltans TaxID=75058 RepID=A0A0S4KLW4_BODSA|nr:zinc finger protein, putative [Bodo saltans]|eukprot:CUI15615.1 zinc finger protein, putative [Bodo saltans]